MTTLADRVRALGPLVLRGDIADWVHDLAEPERRREVIGRLSAGAERSSECRRLYPGLVTLAGIVADFGEVETLGAIGRGATRLRIERLSVP